MFSTKTECFHDTVGTFSRTFMQSSQFKEDAILTVDDIGKGANFTKKHLLGNEWFNLKDNQFELYKLLYKVFIEQQCKYYWATMTWSYGDQASMFYSLLRYFNSYESFEQYRRVNNEMHSENYNFACCQDLERHYQQLEHL